MWNDERETCRLKTCGQPYPAVLPPADREAAHCLDKCRLASVHGSLSVLGCLFRVPFGGTEGRHENRAYPARHVTAGNNNHSFKRKYSINSLVYWVTYVHNVVYSFYRSMIYCYINSTQRCAGSIVIDIIPTNGADKRKFFPFAPYFPVTNVIKRYFYPYFPAIIGIKGYSFPYFPYLSGIMKIKTALYSLFSRLDWHKTVVFPCLGEIYEGIRSLSWEIPVT